MTLKIGAKHGEPVHLIHRQDGEEDAYLGTIHVDKHRSQVKIVFRLDKAIRIYRDKVFKGGIDDR